MTTEPSFHHAQIVRSLPTWCKALPARRLPDLLSRLRKDYLQADGTVHAWYAKASAEDQQALNAAIDLRDLSRKALQDALKPLKGVTEFCKPLLQQRLGIDDPVDRVQYHFQPFKQVREVLTEPTAAIAAQADKARYERDPNGKPRTLSLLEAALHNFESADEAGPFSTLQRSKTDASPVTGPVAGLTAAGFVKICRDLDLGQQYQTHLESLYEGPASASIQRLSIQASRDELCVQAWIARLRDRVTVAGHAALMQLCENAASPRYGSQALKCWRISLFATPLNEVLLIGPDQDNATNPCMVYIPGAPDAPLREYASASQAASDLAKRMQETDLLRVMVGLAPHTLQADLTTKLRQALFVEKRLFGRKVRLNKKAPRLLYERVALPDNPWITLHHNHVRRLKSDAASIAVPTADAEAKSRLERLEHWLSVGLDVLNVAAMFVPLLNPIMMTIGAAQIMGSVFHGIEAWEDDDTAEALAQVESIAVNVASAAAIGAGLKALKASGFVDALQSIHHEGGERLWRPDLATYQNPVELSGDVSADAQGLYTLDDQHYVRIEGQTYALEQDAHGDWQLLHPSTTDAYRPRLTHNGHGAWRLALEQPLDWSDLQLMRRLGHVTDGLEDADLIMAMAATGTDANVLRRVHIDGQRPPALLIDALKRLRIDRETDDVIARVRLAQPLAAYKHYALPALPTLPGWPEDHVILAFEGPESVGKVTRYGAAQAPGEVQIKITRTELEQGQLSQTVLRQMNPQAVTTLLSVNGAQAQDASALNDILANHLAGQRTSVFESLYKSRRPALGAAAEVLARQFGGLPVDALEALLDNASPAEAQRLAAGRVPLRIAEEARRLQARARLDQALLGLNRPNLANADSQKLANALALEQPDASPAERLDAAQADRGLAARLIGQQPIKPRWRSPMRLSDGRRGYPLSGRFRFSNLLRSGRDATHTHLQSLYPGLDREQIRALARDMARHGDVAGQIRVLGEQRTTLAESLQNWTDTGPQDEYDNRRRLSRQLNRTWGRDGGQHLHLDYLVLDTLPSLPVSFPHITELSMDSLHLQTIPEDFLQSFPNLQRLELANNPQLDTRALFQALRSAPGLRALAINRTPIAQLDAAAREALGAMRHLHTLHISRAGLSLNAADMRLLAQLPLQILQLDANAIDLTPNLAAHFSQMTSLRELSLSNNPLGNAPQLGELHNLEGLYLDGCLLTQWPTGLTELMERQDCRLRDLQLSTNHITEFPTLDRILQSPFVNELRTGRRLIIWTFFDNGIPEQTAERLRGAGVRVLETRELQQPQVPQADVPAVPPEVAPVRWLATASDTQRQLWNDLFEDGAYPDLRQVLERVGRSAQARNSPRALARQIWALLETASRDEYLRDHLEQIASDFPATCGDAGTDGLSTLEIEVLAYNESADGNIAGPHLFGFYSRLYRREQVNELAMRIYASRLRRQAGYRAWNNLSAAQRGAISALPPLDPLDDISLEQLEQSLVDDIEIRLALRQATAARLEFPEPSHEMLYRPTAMISERTVDEVVDAVERFEEDKNNDPLRQTWIARQPSWQRFIKKRFAVDFDALNERWQSGLDYLEFCMDAEAEPVETLDGVVIEVLTPVLPEPPQDAAGQLRRVQINEGVHLKATSVLLQGRQSEVEALLLDLTKQQDPNAH
ncbi:MULTISPECIES: dermonecrotic toxin domain-containing protein [Pseudomonas]|uniref:RING-type E3 ubiquitin transferase n=1 Tax=Pseudomonas putida TaxID=303 RepID=A0A1B2F3M8_PSEPU|nr:MULTISPECIES: DUF6543 domain-containing protein [Pseudomonas]ANY86879.1 Leucine Rich repeats protein [Pseudomonas putida]MCL8305311.1 hypothetical protein [Pseudomonas putida]